MNPDDYEQDDPNTDNMFALMDKIKNCKEQNKNLTDEERRQNAEKLMMQLAGLMGESDGSSGEDKE